MVTIAVDIVACTTPPYVGTTRRKLCREFPLTITMIFGVSTLLYIVGTIVRSTVSIKTK